MNAAHRLPLLAAVLLAGLAVAAEPTREEVDRLVRQLGSGDFNERERATERLWQAGRVAEPALTEAVKSRDPEISRRARDLLDKFKWGIYPDTPAPVAALIRRYQHGNEAAKQESVKKLLELGVLGCGAVARLAAAEDDPDARQLLVHQVTTEAARAVPALISEGKLDTLEDLLHACTALGEDQVYRHYAVCLALRGRIDARLPHYRARAAVGDKSAAEVAYWLCRVRGDLAGARAALDKVDMPGFLEPILRLQGDWKALDALLEKADAGRSAGQVQSLRAACQRRLGDGAAFARTIAALSETARQATREGIMPWEPVKGLLLNERPLDALAVLPPDDGFDVAFDLRCLRFEYREAFALADAETRRESAVRLFADLLRTLIPGCRWRPAPDLAAFRAELARARVLHQLGEAKQSQALFERLGQVARSMEEPELQELLVETLRKAGQMGPARVHVAELLGKQLGEKQEWRILYRLFPEHTDQAHFGWHALRKRFPGDTGEATLRRLQAVFEGRATAQELTGAAEAALRPDIAAGVGLAQHHEAWVRAVADGARRAGRPEQGRAALEQGLAKSDEPALRRALGDVCGELGHWRLAAEHYARAWDKDRREATALALRGKALLQLGEEKEGRRLLELARWLPLGNGEERDALATALERAGLADEARRERELTVRLATSLEGTEASPFYREAMAALTRRDFVRAADAYEQLTLIAMHTDVWFRDTEAYSLLPAIIRRCRARAHLDAGRVAEALAEARQALDSSPGDVEVPILLAAGLAKRGRGADADALYARVADKYERLCRDYPRSAWGHNSLAWLAACCRRDLDAALEHANQAVRLAPDVTGYMDTLAEVHFQRGDRTRALELMKQCLAKEPKRVYFQRQLKRLEAGDPSVEVPGEYEVGE